MAIVWAVELEDKVSVPATAASEATNRLRDSLGRFVSASNAASGALENLAAAGHVASEASHNVHESLLESVAGGELLAHAMEKVADVAKEALVEAFSFAIEARENVDRLRATFDALGEDGTNAGQQTINAIRSIGAELPQTEKTLVNWTRTLEAAGQTDLSQISRSLRAISASEALVEGGGEHVKNMLAKLEEQSLKGGGKVKFSLAQLAGTGVSEKEFLRALGMTPANFAAAKKAGTLTGAAVSDAITNVLVSKGGKAVDAQMEELSVMEQKAADTARHLFEDVDPKPFTDGVKEFFSVFDEAQPSGQALKKGITTAFNAVYLVAGKTFELLRVGFLHTVIFALQVAVAIKHLPKAIQLVKDTLHAWSDSVAAGFGRVGKALHAWAPVIAGVSAAVFTFFVPSMLAAGASTLWWASTAIPAAIAAAGAFVVSIYAAVAGAVVWAITAIPAAVVATGAFIVSMATAAIATLAATWPLLLIAAAVGLVVFGIYELVRHWDKVKTFFVGLAKGAWDAAVGFVEGLVNGIENGITKVVDAAKNMGHKALQAVKDVLGIHSPSSVLFGLGVHTSGGFAGGIAQGTPSVQDAALTMADAAVPQQGGGGLGGGGSRSVTISIGDITLRFDAAQAGSAADLRGVVEEAIAALGDRLALMVGSAPAVGG